MKKDQTEEMAAAASDEEITPTPPLKSKKDYAMFYQSKGFSVIPLKNPDHRSDGNEQLEITEGVTERKEPDVHSLDGFKKAAVSEAQILKWYQDENPNRNVGVFCGKVSNNHLVVDSDGEGADNRIDSRVLQNLESEVRTAFLNTMVVTTGSGGKHYYFILNDPIMETMPSVKIWNNDEAKHTEINLLANNHYVVGAGSRHPNGRTYEWNGKSPMPITKKELIEFIRLTAKNPDVALSSLNRKNKHDATTMTMTTMPSTSDGATAIRKREMIQTTTRLGSSDEEGEELTIAEQKVIKILGRLYTSGRREDWWLVVSGLLRRHPNISLKDAINICKDICEDMDDEEIGKRIKTTERTFTTKQPAEVTSRTYFENFVKLQKNGMDKEEVDKYVKNLEREVLAALFELELEVIQRDNPCWLWDNKDGEKYIVVRKSDNYYDVVEGKYLQKIRRVQLLEVKRAPISIDGNVDNLGRGDIIRFGFTEVLLDAVPEGKIETLEDQVFDQVKYRMAFEYIGTDGTVESTGEPIGPFTKEELKTFILTKKTWASKERVLTDTINKMIDACRVKGLVETKIEIEAEGLFWIDSQKRLVLSKREPYLPTPLQAQECLEVIEELQEKFYPVNIRDGIERKRLSHFIKIGLVGVISFARRQLGAVRDGERYVIPIQDLGNWSKVGKTFGYAGLALRVYRNPFHEGNKKYQVAAGSIETEARIIEHTKWTTFPVILDDVDLLTDWQQNNQLAQQARRVLTLIKNSADMTNPRDVQTTVNNKRQLPFCAYVLLTHNSGLINEDGFISRSTGHEFTVDDEKDPEVKKQYEEFFTEYGYIFGYIGDFAIYYYLQHPEILRKDWLIIARTVINALFEHAGLDNEERKEFQWLLDEVCESATSRKGIAEARSVRIASTLSDMILNQAWSKWKKEGARLIGQRFREKFLDTGNIDWNDWSYRIDMESIMSSATAKEKIWALLQIEGALPDFRWSDKYGVCMTSGIIHEFEKRGIQRISHTSLPSYCGSKKFTYTKNPLWFGEKQMRVVYASLKDFAEFLSPGS
jgi:hypothetical protein